MSWLVSLFALCCILITTGYFYGPRAAAGLTTIFSLALPKWVAYEILELDVDLRVATGIAALSYYCIHPKSAFKTRLVAVDFAMISLIAINIASDFIHDGANWMTIGQAYGEWFVPYVVGRIAVDRWSDVEFLVKPIAITCLMMSVVGIVESVTEHNLYEILFGARPFGIGKYMERFGWRRAFGPTENPIYFGVLLLLFLPWNIQLMLTKYRFTLGALATAVNLAGIVSSLSRAPILSIALLVMSPLVLRMQKAWRVPIAILLLVSVGLLGFNFKEAAELLQGAVGESSTINTPTIELDGQRVEYTSTKHRVYIFSLYGTALRQAGFLGYGSDKTSVFPPHVPMGGKHDIEAVKQLWCVDNQFILTTLRFGYLGLIAWVAVLLMTLLAFYQLSSNSKSVEASFYSFMAGTIVAMFFVQFTVWMPHDYGFLLLWTCGMAAGAWSGKSSGGDDYLLSDY